MKNNKVGIIVVNWNRKDDTLRCIESVLQSTEEAYELLIVDNASTDGSAEAIRHWFPEVTLHVNEENGGFTGGNNIGLRYFLERGTSYILLLNNDAIIAPDTLSRMVTVAEAMPDAGFFGPQIRSIKDDDRVLSAGGVLLDGWQPLHDGRVTDFAVEPTSVDFLSGCALMVSRKAVETIGMLHDDYFAYYEDVDWCYRAQQAGFRLIYVPGASVWHPDTTLRDETSANIVYYMTRNSLLFARANGLDWMTRGHMWRTHLATLASWSLWPKWRHKREQRDALFAALADFLRGRIGKRPSQI